jgi:hypothetical protein
MEHPGRIARWNRLYDEAPADLRFQVLIWALVAIGALNMMLTIWMGFPFGLLLVIAIAAIAWIRVAPRLDLAGPMRAPELIRQPDPGEDERTILGGWANSFPAFNTWMDGLTEMQRLGVHLGILGAAGVLNMLFSIHGDFPFGLLFLLALVALAVIRGPWVRARTRAQYREAREARRARPAGLLEHGETAHGGAPALPDAGAAMR